MVKVEIICPNCSEKGYIDISTDVKSEASRGLVAVSIKKDIVCSHEFIAYVDRNYVARDYFIADFKIHTPIITDTKNFKEIKIPEKKGFDVDLIKLNISAFLMTCILNAIFTKKKIVLINENDFLREQIFNFFKYITEETFDIDMAIYSEEEYEKIKDKEPNFVNFNLQEIFYQNKLINLNKLKIEKKIVQEFYTEVNSKSSLIVLKNEIYKAYYISNLIKEYIIQNKKKKTIYSKKVITYLKNAYKINLSIQYLNFIIDILKNYFSISINLRFPNVSNIW
ncbi:MAG: hypothetical protein ACFFAO_19270 [Candidatus Hermodarchaeota archaeon]